MYQREEHGFLAPGRVPTKSGFSLQPNRDGAFFQRSATVNRNGVSIKGPALLGLTAVAIAGVWIYLLFAVIPAVFNVTPAP
jgi:hypothetical protein